MAVSLQPVFKSRILLHVAGWIIFLITPLLLSPTYDFAAMLQDTSNLESMVLRSLILMILFYLNLYYLTPIVLKQQGVATFLIILVLTVIGVSILLWQIHHKFSEPFRPQIDRGPMPNLGFGPPRPEPASLAGPAFFSFLITIMIVSISTSIVLWEDWVKARAEEQERAFQRVASELAVLKLQISPHFLFNTLNNIRWLIRSKSDNAEEAVVKLSQLLRYILYQTHQDKISLDKEIDNLRDYINLQKMRLTDQQNLQYAFTGDAGNKQIVPLLFISIVENLFKYADFESDFQNLIQMNVTGDLLVFITENRVAKKIDSGNKSESGIGLTNIRKRLLLHYPDKHLLTYGEKDGIFKVEMEIILN